ncbi:MAG: hypothetical protein KTR31_02770 [Myxococcales bacterium]|nr:hypothetical protein [Myxococcales bacterium]
MGFLRGLLLVGVVLGPLYMFSLLSPILNTSDLTAQNASYAVVSHEGTVLDAALGTNYITLSDTQIPCSAPSGHGVEVLYDGLKPRRCREAEFVGRLAPSETVKLSVAAVLSVVAFGVWFFQR